MLDQLINRVVQHAATRADELVAARRQWDELTGKVFDDDPLYEERTAGFLEWYALERPGPDGKTPLEDLLAHLSPADPDREGLRLLLGTYRSLFIVRATEEQHLELEDLIGGAIFRVFERRQPLGLSEGDLFEARLCPRSDASGDVLLTRALQHHPREAREAVEAIASGRPPREETLFKLARLRWKAARWGHVSPERIYHGDDGE
ncbi:MAG TPA: hypothetical protein VMV01_16040 [Planctomycetota bacterium]|nr:hypothetical protein [Planctomycetota bacterium]